MSRRSPQHYKLARDAALYRGNLLSVVDNYQREDIARMRKDLKMSKARARAVMHNRLMLKTAVNLESWGVSLARWMLEAAATGKSQAGSSSELFQHCSSALDPTPAALLQTARAWPHRTSRRASRSRPVASTSRCGKIWRSAAAVAATAAFVPLTSFRIGWQPHIAAATGDGSSSTYLGAWHSDGALALGLYPAQPSPMAIDVMTALVSAFRHSQVSRFSRPHAGTGGLGFSTVVLPLPRSAECSPRQRLGGAQPV